MAIDYDRLLALQLPEIEHRYTERDTILYALGIGLGQDPLDETALDFVYEKALKALPTMANILAFPGFWIRELDTGIDWVRVVHGEHKVTLHRPVPVAATVVGTGRIVEIIDKGPGKGAILLSERQIADKASGEPIATILQTSFCRGDGGFGGPPREAPKPHAIPDRPPDIVVDRPTRPEAALIYRLSGDMNPLHADPAAANAAGFDRPILHGLATMGVAGYAVLKAVCGSEPQRIASIAGRFSSPVFPGETIRTEIWRDENLVSFRSLAAERDIVVMSNGRVDLNEVPS